MQRWGTSKVVIKAFHVTIFTRLPQVEPSVKAPMRCRGFAAPYAVNDGRFSPEVAEVLILCAYSGAST